jgi:hypothetical protein
MSLTSAELAERMMQLARERAERDIELYREYGIKLPEVGLFGTIRDLPTSETTRISEDPKGLAKKQIS